MIQSPSIKRRLAIKPAVASPVEKKEAQERYFISLVEQNKHYKMVVAHIVQGTPLTDIAKHFAMNGWITVNEKTFVEALRTFRRARAQELADYELTDINKLVNPNQPALDEIAALEHLARIQMFRLGIDVKNEKDIGKLFNTTAREVEVTRRIAETIAKARGKIKDGGSGSMEAQSQDVLEDLSKIKKDEGTRNRLHSLTSQLLKNKDDRSDD